MEPTKANAVDISDYNGETAANDAALKVERPVLDADQQIVFTLNTLEDGVFIKKPVIGGEDVCEHEQMNGGDYLVKDKFTKINNIPSLGEPYYQENGGLYQHEELLSEYSVDDSTLLDNDYAVDNLIDEALEEIDFEEQVDAKLSKPETILTSVGEIIAPAQPEPQLQPVEFTVKLQAMEEERELHVPDMQVTEEAFGLEDAGIVHELPTRQMSRQISLPEHDNVLTLQKSEEEITLELPEIPEMNDRGDDGAVGGAQFPSRQLSLPEVHDVLVIESSESEVTLAVPGLVIDDDEGVAGVKQNYIVEHTEILSPVKTSRKVEIEQTDLSSKADVQTLDHSWCPSKVEAEHMLDDLPQQLAVADQEVHVGLQKLNLADGAFIILPSQDDTALIETEKDKSVSGSTGTSFEELPKITADVKLHAEEDKYSYLVQDVRDHNVEDTEIMRELPARQLSRQISLPERDTVLTLQKSEEEITLELPDTILETQDTEGETSVASISRLPSRQISLPELHDVLVIESSEMEITLAVPGLVIDESEEFDQDAATVEFSKQLVKEVQKQAVELVLNENAKAPEFTLEVFDAIPQTKQLESAQQEKLEEIVIPEIRIFESEAESETLDGFVAVEDDEAAQNVTESDRDSFTFQMSIEGQIIEDADQGTVDRVKLETEPESVQINLEHFSENLSELEANWGQVILTSHKVLADDQESTSETKVQGNDNLDRTTEADDKLLTPEVAPCFDVTLDDEIPESSVRLEESQLQFVLPREQVDYQDATKSKPYDIIFSERPTEGELLEHYDEPEPVQIDLEDLRAQFDQMESEKNKIFLTSYKTLVDDEENVLKNQPSDNLERTTETGDKLFAPIIAPDLEVNFDDELADEKSVMPNASIWEGSPVDGKLRGITANEPMDILVSGQSNALSAVEEEELAAQIVANAQQLALLSLSTNSTAVVSETDYDIVHHPQIYQTSEELAQEVSARQLLLSDNVFLDGPFTNHETATTEPKNDSDATDVTEFSHDMQLSLDYMPDLVLAIDLEEKIRLLEYKLPDDILIIFPSKDDVALSETEPEQNELSYLESIQGTTSPEPVTAQSHLMFEMNTQGTQDIEAMPVTEMSVEANIAKILQQEAQTLPEASLGAETEQGSRELEPNHMPIPDVESVCNIEDTTRVVLGSFNTASEESDVPDIRLTSYRSIEEPELLTTVDPSPVTNTVEAVQKSFITNIISEMNIEEGAESCLITKNDSLLIEKPMLMEKVTDAQDYEIASKNLEINVHTLSCEIEGEIASIENVLLETKVLDKYSTPSDVEIVEAPRYKTNELDLAPEIEPGDNVALLDCKLPDNILISFPSKDSTIPKQMDFDEIEVSMVESRLEASATEAHIPHGEHIVKAKALDIEAVSTGIAEDDVEQSTPVVVESLDMALEELDLPDIHLTSYKSIEEPEMLTTPEPSPVTNTVETAQKSLIADLIPEMNIEDVVESRLVTNNDSLLIERPMLEEKLTDAQDHEMVSTDLEAEVQTPAIEVEDELSPIENVLLATEVVTLESRPSDIEAVEAPSNETDELDLVPAFEAEEEMTTGVEVETSEEQMTIRVEDITIDNAANEKVDLAERFEENTITEPVLDSKTNATVEAEIAQILQMEAQTLSQVSLAEVAELRSKEFQPAHMPTADVELVGDVDFEETAPAVVESLDMGLQEVDLPDIHLTSYRSIEEPEMLATPEPSPVTNTVETAQKSFIADLIPEMNIEDVVESRLLTNNDSLLIERPMLEEKLTDAHDHEMVSTDLEAEVQTPAIEVEDELSPIVNVLLATEVVTLESSPSDIEAVEAPSNEADELDLVPAFEAEEEMTTGVEAETSEQQMSIRVEDMTMDDAANAKVDLAERFEENTMTEPVLLESRTNATVEAEIAQILQMEAQALSQVSLAEVAELCSKEFEPAHMPTADVEPVCDVDFEETAPAVVESLDMGVQEVDLPDIHLTSYRSIEEPEMLATPEPSPVTNTVETAQKSLIADLIPEMNIEDVVESRLLTNHDSLLIERPMFVEKLMDAQDHEIVSTTLEADVQIPTIEVEEEPIENVLLATEVVTLDSSPSDMETVVEAPCNEIDELDLAPYIEPGDDIALLDYKLPDDILISFPSKDSTVPEQTDFNEIKVSMVKSTLEASATESNIPDGEDIVEANALDIEVAAVGEISIHEIPAFPEVETSEQLMSMHVEDMTINDVAYDKVSFAAMLEENIRLQPMTDTEDDVEQSAPVVVESLDMALEELDLPDIRLTSYKSIEEQEMLTTPESSPVTNTVETAQKSLIADIIPEMNVEDVVESRLVTNNDSLLIERPMLMEKLIDAHDHEIVSTDLEAEDQTLAFEVEEELSPIENVSLATEVVTLDSSPSDIETAEAPCNEADELDLVPAFEAGDNVTLLGYKLPDNIVISFPSKDSSIMPQLDEEDIDFIVEENTPEETAAVTEGPYEENIAEEKALEIEAVVLGETPVEEITTGVEVETSEQQMSIRVEDMTMDDAANAKVDLAERFEENTMTEPVLLESRTNATVEAEIAQILQMEAQALSQVSLAEVAELCSKEFEPAHMPTADVEPVCDVDFEETAPAVVESLDMGVQELDLPDIHLTSYRSIEEPEMLATPELSPVTNTVETAQKSLIADLIPEMNIEDVVESRLLTNNDSLLIERPMFVEKLTDAQDHEIVSTNLEADVQIPTIEVEEEPIENVLLATEVVTLESSPSDIEAVEARSNEADELDLVPAFEAEEELTTGVEVETSEEQMTIWVEDMTMDDTANEKVDLAERFEENTITEPVLDSKTNATVEAEIAQILQMEAQALSQVSLAEVAELRSKEFEPAHMPTADVELVSDVDFEETAPAVVESLDIGLQEVDLPDIHLTSYRSIEEPEMLTTPEPSPVTNTVETAQKSLIADLIPEMNIEDVVESRLLTDNNSLIIERPMLMEKLIDAQDHEIVSTDLEAEVQTPAIEVEEELSPIENVLLATEVVTLDSSPSDIETAEAPCNEADALDLVPAFEAGDNVTLLDYKLPDNIEISFPSKDSCIMQQLDEEDIDFIVEENTPEETAAVTEVPYEEDIAEEKALEIEAVVLGEKPVGEMTTGVEVETSEQQMSIGVEDMTMDDTANEKFELAERFEENTMTEPVLLESRTNATVEAEIAQILQMEAQALSQVSLAEVAELCSKEFEPAHMPTADVEPVCDVDFEETAPAVVESLDMGVQELDLPDIHLTSYRSIEEPEMLATPEPSPVTNTVETAQKSLIADLIPEMNIEDVVESRLLTNNDSLLIERPMFVEKLTDAQDHEIVSTNLEADVQIPTIEVEEEPIENVLLATEVVTLESSPSDIEAVEAPSNEADELDLVPAFEAEEELTTGVEVETSEEQMTIWVEDMTMDDTANEKVDLAERFEENTITEPVLDSKTNATVEAEIAQILQMEAQALSQVSLAEVAELRSKEFEPAHMPTADVELVSDVDFEETAPAVVESLDIGLQEVDLPDIHLTSYRSIEEPEMLTTPEPSPVTNTVETAQKSLIADLIPEMNIEDVVESRLLTDNNSLIIERPMLMEKLIDAQDHEIVSTDLEAEVQTPAIEVEEELSPIENVLLATEVVTLDSSPSDTETAEAPCNEADELDLVPAFEAGDNVTLLDYKLPDNIEISFPSKDSCIMPTLDEEDIDFIVEENTPEETAAVTEVPYEEDIAEEKALEIEAVVLGEKPVGEMTTGVEVETSEQQMSIRVEDMTMDDTANEKFELAERFEENTMTEPVLLESRTNATVEAEIAQILQMEAQALSQVSLAEVAELCSKEFEPAHMPTAGVEPVCDVDFEETAPAVVESMDMGVPELDLPDIHLTSYRSIEEPEMLATPEPSPVTNTVETAQKSLIADLIPEMNIEDAVESRLVTNNDSLLIERPMFVKKLTDAHDHEIVSTDLEADVQIPTIEVEEEPIENVLLATEVVTLDSSPSDMETVEASCNEIDELDLAPDIEPGDDIALLDYKLPDDILISFPSKDSTVPEQTDFNEIEVSMVESTLEASPTEANIPDSEDIVEANALDIEVAPVGEISIHEIPAFPEVETSEQLMSMHVEDMTINDVANDKVSLAAMLEENIRLEPKTDTEDDVEQSAPVVVESLDMALEELDLPDIHLTCYKSIEEQEMLTTPEPSPVTNTVETAQKSLIADIIPEMNIEDVVESRLLTNNDSLLIERPMLEEKLTDAQDHEMVSTDLEAEVQTPAIEVEDELSPIENVLLATEVVTLESRPSDIEAVEAPSNETDELDLVPAFEAEEEMTTGVEVETSEEQMTIRVEDITIDNAANEKVDLAERFEENTITEPVLDSKTNATVEAEIAQILQMEAQTLSQVSLAEVAELRSKEFQPAHMPTADVELVGDVDFEETAPAVVESLDMGLQEVDLPDIHLTSYRSIEEPEMLATPEPSPVTNTVETAQKSLIADLIPEMNIEDVVESRLLTNNDSLLIERPMLMEKFVDAQDHEIVSTDLKAEVQTPAFEVEEELSPIENVLLATKVVTLDSSPSDIETAEAPCNEADELDVVPAFEAGDNVTLLDYKLPDNIVISFPSKDSGIMPQLDEEDSDFIVEENTPEETTAVGASSHEEYIAEEKALEIEAVLVFEKPVVASRDIHLTSFRLIEDHDVSTTAPEPIDITYTVETQEKSLSMDAVPEIIVDDVQDNALQRFASPEHDTIVLETKEDISEYKPHDIEMDVKHLVETSVLPETDDTLELFLPKESCIEEQYLDAVIVDRTSAAADPRLSTWKVSDEQAVSCVMVESDNEIVVNEVDILPEESETVQEVEIQEEYLQAVIREKAETQIFVPTDRLASEKMTDTEIMPDITEADTFNLTVPQVVLEDEVDEVAKVATCNEITSPIQEEDSWGEAPLVSECFLDERRTSIVTVTESVMSEVLETLLCPVEEIQAPQLEQNVPDEHQPMVECRLDERVALEADIAELTLSDDENQMTTSFMANTEMEEIYSPRSWNLANMEQKQEFVSEAFVDEFHIDDAEVVVADTNSTELKQFIPVTQEAVMELPQRATDQDQLLLSTVESREQIIDILEMSTCDATMDTQASTLISAPSHENLEFIQPQKELATEAKSYDLTTEDNARFEIVIKDDLLQPTSLDAASDSTEYLQPPSIQNTTEAQDHSITVNDERELLQGTEHSISVMAATALELSEPLVNETFVEVGQRKLELVDDSYQPELNPQEDECDEITCSFLPVDSSMTLIKPSRLSEIEPDMSLDNEQVESAEIELESVPEAAVPQTECVYNLVFTQPESEQISNILPEQQLSIDFKENDIEISEAMELEIMDTQAKSVLSVGPNEKFEHFQTPNMECTTEAKLHDMVIADSMTLEPENELQHASLSVTKEKTEDLQQPSLQYSIDVQDRSLTVDDQTVLTVEIEEEPLPISLVTAATLEFSEPADENMIEEEERVATDVELADAHYQPELDQQQDEYDEITYTSLHVDNSTILVKPSRLQEIESVDNEEIESAEVELESFSAATVSETEGAYDVSYRQHESEQISNDEIELPMQLDSREKSIEISQARTLEVRETTEQSLFSAPSNEKLEYFQPPDKEYTTETKSHDMVIEESITVESDREMQPTSLDITGDNTEYLQQPVKQYSIEAQDHSITVDEQTELPIEVDEEQLPICLVTAQTLELSEPVVEETIEEVEKKASDVELAGDGFQPDLYPQQDEYDEIAYTSVPVDNSTILVKPSKLQEIEPNIYLGNEEFESAEVELESASAATVSETESAYDMSYTQHESEQISNNEIELPMQLDSREQNLEISQARTLEVRETTEQSLFSAPSNEKLEYFQPSDKEHAIEAKSHDMVIEDSITVESDHAIQPTSFDITRDNTEYLQQPVKQYSIEAQDHSIIVDEQTELPVEVEEEQLPISVVTVATLELSEPVESEMIEEVKQVANNVELVYDYYQPELYPQQDEYDEISYKSLPVDNSTILRKPSRLQEIELDISVSNEEVESAEIELESFSAATVSETENVYDVSHTHLESEHISNVTIEQPEQLSVDSHEQNIQVSEAIELEIIDDKEHSVNFALSNENLQYFQLPEKEYATETKSHDVVIEDIVTVEQDYEMQPASLDIARENPEYILPPIKQSSIEVQDHSIIVNEQTEPLSEVEGLLQQTTSMMMTTPEFLMEEKLAVAQQEEKELTDVVDESFLPDRSQDQDQYDKVVYTNLLVDRTITLVKPSKMQEVEPEIDITELASDELPQETLSESRTEQYEHATDVFEASIQQDEQTAADNLERLNEQFATETKDLEMILEDSDITLDHIDSQTVLLLTPMLNEKTELLQPAMKEYCADQQICELAIEDSLLLGEQDQTLFTPSTMTLSETEQMEQPCESLPAEMLEPETLTSKVKEANVLFDLASMTDLVEIPPRLDEMMVHELIAKEIDRHPITLPAISGEILEEDIVADEEPISDEILLDQQVTAIVEEPIPLKQEPISEVAAHEMSTEIHDIEVTEDATSQWPIYNKVEEHEQLELPVQKHEEPVISAEVACKETAAESVEIEMEYNPQQLSMHTSIDDKATYLMSPIDEGIVSPSSEEWKQKEDLYDEPVAEEVLTTTDTLTTEAFNEVTDVLQSSHEEGMISDEWTELESTETSDHVQDDQHVAVVDTSNLKIKAEDAINEEWTEPEHRGFIEERYGVQMTCAEVPEAQEQEQEMNEEWTEEQHTGFTEQRFGVSETGIEGTKTEEQEQEMNEEWTEEQHTGFTEQRFGVSETGVEETKTEEQEMNDEWTEEQHTGFTEERFGGATDFARNVQEGEGLKEEWIEDTRTSSSRRARKMKSGEGDEGGMNDEWTEEFVSGFREERFAREGGAKKKHEARLVRTRNVGADGEIIESMETVEYDSDEDSDAGSLPTSRRSSIASTSAFQFTDSSTPAVGGAGPEGGAHITVFTDTVEGDPEVDTDVAEFQDTLPDGTVVKRKTTTVRTKQTITKRVVLEGVDDETMTSPFVDPSSSSSFSSPPRTAISSGRSSSMDDAAQHFTRYSDRSSTEPEVSRETETSEDTLKDGTVVRTRTTNTRQQQLITERLVLGGTGLFDTEKNAGGAGVGEEEILDSLKRLGQSSRQSSFGSADNLKSSPTTEGQRYSSRGESFPISALLSPTEGMPLSLYPLAQGLSSPWSVTEGLTSEPWSMMVDRPTEPFYDSSESWSNYLPSEHVFEDVGQEPYGQFNQGPVEWDSSRMEITPSAYAQENTIVPAEQQQTERSCSLPERQIQEVVFSTGHPSDYSDTHYTETDTCSTDIPQAAYETSQQFLNVDSKLNKLDTLPISQPSSKCTTSVSLVCSSSSQISSSSLSCSLLSPSASPGITTNSCMTTSLLTSVATAPIPTACLTQSIGPPSNPRSPSITSTSPSSVVTPSRTASFLSSPSTSPMPSTSPPRSPSAPSLTQECEESEEVHPDGSTVRRRLVRTRVRKVVTRRIRRVTSDGQVTETTEELLPSGGEDQYDGTSTEYHPASRDDSGALCGFAREPSRVLLGAGRSCGVGITLNADVDSATARTTRDDMAEGILSTRTAERVQPSLLVDVYMDTTEEVEPEVQSEVEIVRETLPDGRVLERRIVRTCRRRKVVKRVTVHDRSRSSTPRPVTPTEQCAVVSDSSCGIASTDNRSSLSALDVQGTVSTGLISHESRSNVADTESRSNMAPTKAHQSTEVVKHAAAKEIGASENISGFGVEERQKTSEVNILERVDEIFVDAGVGFFSPELTDTSGTTSSTSSAVSYSGGTPVADDDDDWDIVPISDNSQLSCSPLGQPIWDSQLSAASSLGQPLWDSHVSSASHAQPIWDSQMSTAASLELADSLNSNSSELSLHPCSSAAVDRKATAMEISVSSVGTSRSEEGVMHDSLDPDWWIGEGDSDVEVLVRGADDSFMWGSPSGHHPGQHDDDWQILTTAATATSTSLTSIATTSVATTTAVGRATAAVTQQLGAEARTDSSEAPKPPTGRRDTKR